MIVLTAGDHRFQAFVERSRRNALAYGYQVEVWNLGGLDVEGQREFDFAALGEGGWSEQFHRRGYYEKVAPRWQSRALHKPSIVEECLAGTRDLVAYLDGDACLVDAVDEISTGDYDVGVALRAPDETTGSPEMAGVTNAGVIFFAPTPASRRFVARWRRATFELRNDQRALNRLLFADVRPWRLCRQRFVYRPDKVPERLEVDGLRLRVFPHHYNCSLFPPPREAKILHYKSDQFAAFKSAEPPAPAVAAER